MKRNKPEEIALNSTAHIGEIGEREGKKSLFEDTNLISKLRRFGKKPGDFRLDFQVLLLLQR